MTAFLLQVGGQKGIEGDIKNFGCFFYVGANQCPKLLFHFVSLESVIM